MYALIGKLEGKLLTPNKIYNTSYFSDQELLSFIEEGETKVDVEELKEQPDNPKPDKYYTYQYDIEAKEFVYTEHDIEPSQKETIEQQIANMQQDITNTQIGLTEVYELLLGGTL